MTQRLFLPLALTGIIGAGVASEVGCGGSAASGTTTPTTGSATASTASSPASVASTSPAAKRYRKRVTAAANAWLGTLTAAQRKTATYSFGDTADKQKWSNFPAFFKPRTGVAYKSMSAASAKAGLALVKTTLSSQGFKQYQGIRAADDYQGLKQSNFGGENYYLSVFGTPSAAKPYMVSFNGHHMTFNVTFNARLANTPEFTGVEPTKFTLDRKDYTPMKAEAAPIFALLPKLPTAAKLSQSFDDVLVGPQKDGQFPAKASGVTVDSLPAAQRELVTKLITAYVGDVPPVIAKPLIAAYEKQYAKTYVAYAGGTTDAPGTYIRIDGPRAWIELAVQSSDQGSSHYHSVYRDKAHDYGA